MRRHELRRLAGQLRAQGMDKAAARRMAEEWLCHLADLIEDEGVGASCNDDQRIAAAMQRLGDVETLLDAVAHLPACTHRRELRGHAVIAIRWSGACAAGVMATFSLFSAMTAAIGM